MMATALHVRVVFKRVLQLIADAGDYIGPLWLPYSTQHQASALLTAYVQGSTAVTGANTAEQQQSHHDTG